MKLSLYCKCGACKDVTSDSPSDLRYERSLFEREHVGPGCKLITGREMKAATKIQRYNKSLKEKKKGKL